jgi:hypothetical protein
VTRGKLTIPERIKIICQELDALYDKSIQSQERIIHRQDILRIAEQRGINPTSAQVADYCYNGTTSQYSRHSFLHIVKDGQYTLNPKDF